MRICVDKCPPKEMGIANFFHKIKVDFNKI